MLGFKIKFKILYFRPLGFYEVNKNVSSWYIIMFEIKNSDSNLICVSCKEAYSKYYLSKIVKVKLDTCNHIICQICANFIQNSGTNKCPVCDQIFNYYTIFPKINY